MKKNRLIYSKKKILGIKKKQFANLIMQMRIVQIA